MLLQVVRGGGWCEESGGGLLPQARVVLEGVLQVADVVDHVLDEFESRHLPVLGDVGDDFSKLVEVESHLGLNLSARRVALRATASVAHTSSSSSATAAHSAHIVACWTHHPALVLHFRVRRITSPKYSKLWQ